MTNTIKSSEALQKPIQILPPQLANQIAAGEVVERPASVVKELVENSLDAGAKQIQIDIEQGGQKRILIRDNGKGISKDELSLALSRHATSKISDIDDLEHITSMGFRGEALASISSVSRLTLTSKPKSQSEAWQARAEGQQMEVDIQPAAHPDGTSIEVTDLFFNTPARRKFLRTGKTEFQHIEQIVKRIALARPDIQFVLTHNQKVCCRYQAVSDLSKRVEQVCGKNMLKDSAKVDYEYEGVKLSGWCSKLGAGANTRDLQYTFVNGRMMKDKLLSHALRQVYEDALAPQTFASYVLYLQVSPEQLDVNVHPAKHEVRFHQARQVHDIVYKAVNDALSADLLQHEQMGNKHTNSSPQSQFEQEPNHDYIQALTPAKNESSFASSNSSSTAPTRPDSNLRYRNQGFQGYQANRPSKRDINANNDFYQSIHETSLNTHAHAASSDAELQCTNYLYTYPFLVFASETATISTLHIKHLLGLVVTDKRNVSTISQPLLMPVSVELDYIIDESLLAQINNAHFLISTMALGKKGEHRSKIILKHVPSELRHLPWAKIFPQLQFENMETCAELTELSHQIAKAWAGVHEIAGNQVTAIVQEVGEKKILELRKASSTNIDLFSHNKERLNDK